jgi:hypothetical protein
MDQGKLEEMMEFLKAIEAERERERSQQSRIGGRKES